MSKCFLIVALVISNVGYLNANVWDNLFFEKNLDLKIPDEFVLKANSQTTFGTLDLSMSVSLILKKTSVSISVNAFSNRKAFESIIDASNNLLVFHTLANSCTKIELNNRISTVFEDSSGFSNLALMFLDRNKEDGYIRIDTQQVFESLNLPGDLYIYYDENSKLKKIKIELSDERSIDFDVTEIKITKLSESDFLIPKNWKCDQEKLKSLDDVRTEDFIGDGIIELQKFLLNLNGRDSSNLVDQLQKFISNNSP